MNGKLLANSDAAIALASSSVLALPAASNSWARRSIQRHGTRLIWRLAASSRAASWTLKENKLQPWAKGNTSRSTGAEYFMESVAEIVLKYPPRPRRIFCFVGTHICLHPHLHERRTSSPTGSRMNCGSARTNSWGAACSDWNPRIPPPPRPGCPPAPRRLNLLAPRLFRGIYCGWRNPATPPLVRLKPRISIKPVRSRSGRGETIPDLGLPSVLPPIGSGALGSPGNDGGESENRSCALDQTTEADRRRGGFASHASGREKTEAASSSN